MKKRVVAALLAVVLAAFGVVSLVTWANDADERAFKGAELTEVLQVTQPIPSGTKAEDLGDSVEPIKVPRVSVPPGIVTDLADLDGLQATVRLERGETLLTSRFAKPTKKPEESPDSAVPVGLQEISVAIAAERQVAITVRTGDRVGVFGSYENPAKDTNVIENRVLVLGVTKTTGLVGGGTISGTGAGTFGGGVTLVTLAVEAKTAKEIVNAAEFGKIWLTRQNSDAETSKGPKIGAQEVLE